MDEMMRAAMFDRYGAPGVLYVARADRPEPGPTDVLVRVEASSVNGGEVIARQGKLRLLTGTKFPQRVGIDLVGEIVGLGADVSDLAIGDRVWGAVDERGRRGAAAEYVIAPAGNVSIAPAALTSVEAASLLSGGNTSLVALRETVRLQPAERLLVRGAAGGVGAVGVQIGKVLGAHVTALANPATFDFVRALGADEVIDYRTPADELGPFDVIFDTRGTDLRTFRRRLAPGGRMVTIAFDIDRIVRSLGDILFSRIHGSRRVRLFFGHPRRELFTELADLVDRGDVRPIVDEAYTLDRIAEAHARLERGGVRGKVVLDVAAVRGESS
ncbi:MAG: NAD(P)-dependent alcohol dehydrogenase [Pseudoclavibacter sp.]